jgi:queuine tRNA-ribosyltransferase
MERTHRWAERSLAASRDVRPGLFGIVQGGVDPDLRRASVAAIGALPFDGLAIGGLSVGESKAAMYRHARRRRGGVGRRPAAAIPHGRRLAGRLLRGGGAGIDLFDCVLPTRVARTGQVWTDAGRLNLRNSAFLDDPAPIDAACACAACRTHSRAYLAHLFRARGAAGLPAGDAPQRDVTLELMRRLRASLADGTFAALAARIGCVRSIRTRRMTSYDGMVECGRDGGVSRPERRIDRIGAR